MPDYKQDETVLLLHFNRVDVLKLAIPLVRDSGFPMCTKPNKCLTLRQLSTHTFELLVGKPVSRLGLNVPSYNIDFLPSTFLLGLEALCQQEPLSISRAYSFCFEGCNRYITGDFSGGRIHIEVDAIVFVELLDILNVVRGSVTLQGNVNRPTRKVQLSYTSEHFAQSTRKQSLQDMCNIVPPMSF